VSAGAEEDWRDMWRLSYALIFEALKLVLLISLMIVRLGTVATEGVRRWLDKGMPRVLDLGHKEGWMDAKETQKKKKTAEENHLCQDEDYHKEDQRSPTTMPDTTSTPESLTSSLNPLQQTTAMPAMFFMPMPPPGTPGSPMFEGANVTEFLERYEDLYSNYHVSAKDRLTRLPWYCIQPIAETIKSLKEWKD
jgi:hypothetical protein